MVRRRQIRVVDYSTWLTYLADAPGADGFAEVIEAPESLVVPAITILEVFKVVLRDRGESEALQAAALMQQGAVVPLDATLALAAAKLGVDHELPLAESVIYATAQEAGAVLWTQDEHFEGLPGVEYRAKR
jgi:toxin FitB